MVSSDRREYHTGRWPRLFQSTPPEVLAPTDSATRLITMTQTNPSPLAARTEHSCAAFSRCLRIDAHQHFWQYTPEEFDWIDDAMAHIRRDFLPADLAPLLRSTGVDTTVAVQARQSLLETEWLLAQADAHDWICGVIGWLPLASPDFPQLLERHAAHPAFCGLRHVLQAEPPSFFEDASFHHGLQQMQSCASSRRNLVYDLLIVEHQMEQAIHLVDRHPNQIFVLDHLAKPRIASGQLEPWARHLRDLASRPHLVCKLSGMVTEADYHRWSIDDLRPYVEIALEAFGPSRLLFGSDWPVCTVAADYNLWFQAVQEMIASCSESEQEAILGGNAARVYQIGPLDARP